MARTSTDARAVALPSADVGATSRSAQDPEARLARARRAMARGREAEELAAEYLVSQGLVLIGRNVRVSRLEIDLLAREGDVVVVVEVRTRGAGAWERALDSVGAAKRLRVRRAGESLWRTRLKADPTLSRMRFDLVSVDLDAEPVPLVEHVRAAF